MQKKWYELSGVLISGGENISGHIEWLTLAAIQATVDTDAVHQVVFNPDLPKDMWGCFYGATRSIAVNLDEHFEFARTSVMDKATNTNIRLVLLHDLLDTIMHEAWHAKKCLAGGDFSNSDLDEEGARAWGEAQSWAIARDFDVEIASFGPLLDQLIHDFHEELKEDCKEADAKQWKRQQLYMLDNNLAYYDMEGTTIKTFREAMAIMADPDAPWPSKVKEYPGDEVAVIEEAAAEEKPTISVEPLTAEYAEDYNPLDDIGVEMYDPFAEEELSLPVESTPVETAAPIQEPVVPPVMQETVTQPVTAGPSAQDLRNAAEMVMRRLFHHVYTKCGAQNNGTFTNPEAVLEPVHIADIPYATELFVGHQTVDNMGNFISFAPTTEGIKGLVSQQRLPRYTFFMNIGGTKVKRTFIPQNPMKTKADGSFTAWAQRVQSGDKIMMLLKDKSGPTADIQLPAGMPLGQETFKVWADK